MQGVIGKGRIERNIAVVAHEQVRAVSIQSPQPGYSKSAGGFLDHAIHVRLDDHLHTEHVMNAAHFPGEQEPHQPPPKRRRNRSKRSKPKTDQRIQEFRIPQ
jgi:hypothetical protein